MADKLRGVVQHLRAASEAFNSAIDFAIETDSPREFLTAWREGDWDTLRDEWPEFELPAVAREGLKKA